MIAKTNLHGVVHGRIIELSQELGLPEGTPILINVAVPDVVEEALPPELEAVCGALADLGDEVDEFNRWYRDSRQTDAGREIDAE